MMKAMVIRSFGSSDLFEEIALPIPSLEKGQVLVKISATSINPVDIKIRSGIYGALAPGFPAILQGDFSGIIESVAEGVFEFKQGDAVYGCAGGIIGNNGALAEYVAIDFRFIARVPSLLSMRQAAALPLVSITAFSALIDGLNLKSSDKVLIHAGAGGVGHIAIQIAKHLGAKVYSTVSCLEKSEVITRLGADPIFYKTETVKDYVDRCTQGKGFDVVFDTVGGQALDDSLSAAAYQGRVATIQGASKHDLAPLFKKELLLKGVFMLGPILNGQNRERHGQILNQIAVWVSQNKLLPIVDEHFFTLTDISEAHRYFETGKHIGKVVIEIK